MQQQYKKLTLRLNEPQYRHLCRQALAAGLKHEPYLRRLLMGSEIRPHPPDAYAGLLQELSAIGNNINQIARKVNSKRFFFGNFNSVIEGQRKIYDAILNLTGGD